MFKRAHIGGRKAKGLTSSINSSAKGSKGLIDDRKCLDRGSSFKRAYVDSKRFTFRL